jgi:8-oxo-dGTP pyrophosphatase MutT (NUDIX family)
MCRRFLGVTIVRHFTATGFVVHDDSIALHWHRKVKAWLPPGGHIEENEDPVQAVLREIEEESGLKAAVVPTTPGLDLDYPAHVHPPFTIMVEDIHDPVQGYHQHIDMIYFCRLTGSPTLNDGWQWVSRSILESASPVVGQDGDETVPPEDVRVLGLLSLDSVVPR